MRDIEEMINLLKKRPGMYIGKENTNTKELYMFLSGFYTGKSVSETITELDVSFYRCFSRYVYDWMDKNNRLKQSKFNFSWHKYFDVFGKEGISLFYLISEKYFQEYHNNCLDVEYRVNNSDEL